jgi:hypothetical protein
VMMLSQKKNLYSPTTTEREEMLRTTQSNA